VIDPTLVIFGQMFLASLLGAIMGAERSVIARQQAGMRTYALVALGSCAFVLSGMYIDAQHLGVVNFDPARIAAAIVQGVGFIGAGLIFMRGESVHGITTAAGLWVSASVGILVAFGMYAVAIFASALTLGIFFGLWFVEQRFKRWHDAE
jgi:putative Mg2+ transporter-C (MgtC) family protein